MLFGRVRKDRQVILAAVTFGSVVWAALLAGVIIPDVGTFLLAFVPVPDFIDPLWVRIAMLVAAAVLPLVVGGAILLLLDPADRLKGLESIAVIERKVRMPMRDGVGLATDIYRPRNASAPVPTVFVRTPYNFNWWDTRNGQPRDVSAMLDAVRRGYATAAMLARIA